MPNPVLNARPKSLLNPGPNSRPVLRPGPAPNSAQTRPAVLATGLRTSAALAPSKGHAAYLAAGAALSAPMSGPPPSSFADATKADPRPPLHVLIVDDDAPVRKACAEIAGSLGYATQVADCVQAARAALARGPVDMVLLDLKLPGGGGIAVLEEVRAQHPETIVVVMTAFATVNSAVEAMRIGAGDYLTKPFTLEELSTVLDRAAHRRVFDVESRSLRDRLRTGKGMGNMIGRSPAMEKLYRILSKVAYSTHPVLILGESGTGKELVARSIHCNGPHGDKPFIPVDCGSLVPTLIESELFGYVKGAFTGANRNKTGLLASADGGTVFLDEIGELPLELQGRLLRALQEKEVRPVGSTQSVPISARVLAATNRDLTAMVANGRFRKDLYFRLNVVNLRIPPLRERKADIPLLAANALDKVRRENGRSYTFSDEALRLMMDYDWPGNVRELEHSIERACALSSGPVLHINDFPTQLQDHRMHAQRQQEDATNGISLAAAGQDQVLSIAEIEKQAILNTIQQMKGDKLMAARLLGIGKTTLYRKLKEYGIGNEESLA
jgi:DNA-binding NtrC family response regulator